MIILNTERGFIEVESWEDIKSLPGFVENLNPAEHELDAAIGFYPFSRQQSLRSWFNSVLFQPFADGCHRAFVRIR